MECPIGEGGHPNGKLKTFGLLLDANAAFAGAFPNMAKITSPLGSNDKPLVQI